MQLILSKDRFHRLVIKSNIIWALFAPIILAAILNVIQIQGLFILKDIVFYFSLIVIIWSTRSITLIRALLKILFFVALLIVITFLFFDLKSWAVYNLRQLLAPLLLVAFGYYITISKESLSSIISLFYKLGIFIILLGICIKIFGLWDVFDLTTYFNLKGIPVDSRGVSYMFYEPSFIYTERLTSTILDPISLGHILAAGSIMIFYGVDIKGTKKWLYLSVFLLGLALTFSKGAILQLVLAVFFFNKALSYKIRFLVPVLFIILTLILINLDGILIHLVGLKNAVINANLFGHGLGMVGNYAKMFAEDLSVYEYFKISDTFIGSILGQIGLIGLLIWLSFFTNVIKYVSVGKKTYVGATIILSQIIVAILSENTLNFTSFIIPGIIGGLLVRKEI